MSQRGWWRLAAVLGVVTPLAAPVCAAGTTRIDSLVTPAIVSVPEPAPILLIGAGLLAFGIFLMLRRGKHDL